jgi:hypothetical protein
LVASLILHPLEECNKREQGASPRKSHAVPAT